MEGIGWADLHTTLLGKRKATQEKITEKCRGPSEGIKAMLAPAALPHTITKAYWDPCNQHVRQQPASDFKLRPKNHSEEDDLLPLSPYSYKWSKHWNLTAGFGLAWASRSSFINSPYPKRRNLQSIQKYFFASTVCPLPAGEESLWPWLHRLCTSFGRAWLGRWPAHPFWWREAVMLPQHKCLSQAGVCLPCKVSFYKLHQTWNVTNPSLALSLQFGPAQSTASGCSEWVSGPRCPRTHAVLFGCIVSAKVMLIQIS